MLMPQTTSQPAILILKIFITSLADASLGK